MLSFFVATAMLAYRSLYRLTDEWIALAATLLSFSSFYCLYYNDMIATEGVVGVFAVMLVFHGMVVFVQDGHFRQLLIKTCIALLLDWHVFALLLPFIIFTSGDELLHHVRARSGSRKHLVLSLLHSRSLTLGVVSLLFGMSVLASNFVMEYIALNGERSLTQLPSWDSMLRRTGQSTTGFSEFSHILSWGAFLKQQFSWIGAMVYPYYLLDQVFVVQNPWSIPDLSVLGIIAFVACLIGLIFTRHRILSATLLVSGFFWTLPVRHSAAFHDFESMYYIGIPLILFSFGASGLLWTCRLFNNQVIVRLNRIFLAITSFLAFVFSSFYMNQAGYVGYSHEASEFHEKLVDDFDTIRKITKQSTVVIPQNLHENLQDIMTDSDGYVYVSPHMISYYLSGNVILDESKQKFWDLSDFILKPKHEEASSALITPENELVFLYDQTIYDREQKYLKQYESVVAADDPAIRSEFDVYYKQNRLIYIKEPCSLDDINGRFFIQIPDFARNVSDHQQWNGSSGNISFRFQDKGMRYGEKCIAEVALPLIEDNIKYVRTEQYDSSGRIWRGGFSTYAYALTNLRKDPVTRSTFDLYLDGNILYYVKAPCSFNDMESDFFIDIYPVHVRDLPNHRKRHGFETIIFNFQKSGMRIDEQCIMRILLPEYVIDHIETGQQTADKSTLWDMIYIFNARDKYEMIASDEPDVSSDFNVYHIKNTLVYVREPCTPVDVRPMFYLHIVPVDRTDLPDRRKRFGFDNLDFGFPPISEYFDKKCLATVLLPEYEMASIQTGQFSVHWREDGSIYFKNIWGGEFLVRRQ